jgi:glutamate racemase
MRLTPFHVGVFDSGVGGLTVLKALKAELPSTRFTYLGDMARLPYGTKSQDVVVQYSMKAVDMLVALGVDVVVIACSTASSAAVPAIQAKYPDLYVLDVIEPTVNHAIKFSSAQNFLVLGTERTISSGAYTKLIQAQSSFAQVAGIATPLLVSMAEEGWADMSIVEQILAHYIPQSLRDSNVDAVILGCTHFPFFETSFRHFFGKNVAIVDSASPTALALKDYLVDLNGLTVAADLDGARETRYLVTDSPERFLRIASYFLNDKIRPENIEFVHFS